MMDMFPFPRLTGNTPDEKIDSIINYLIQFKETLEYALKDISMDNLSPELIKKIEALGADIEQGNIERDNAVAQLSHNITKEG